MRLDDRHVRFARPFWPQFGRKLVRLGKRRGSLQLQETALVAEGELLRFRYLGFEVFFRRALSEWTTVTVPYSRIVVAPRSRKGLWVAAALIAAAWGVIVLTASDAADWLLGGGLAAIFTGLVVYVVRRIAGLQSVAFRGRDGRLRLLAFRVRPKVVRAAFAAALEDHRRAAVGHATARPGVVA